MQKVWHMKGELPCQIHRGTAQGKVMQWLLAAWVPQDAYLNEKTLYLIFLLNHQPAMVYLHIQANKHELSICY